MAVAHNSESNCSAVSVRPRLNPRRSGGDKVGVRVAAYDRTRPLIIDPTVTYATYVSGSGFDNVNWSARDQAGNQYLTGLACSSDFPVGTIFEQS